jgi:hypothetical protein
VSVTRLYRHTQRGTLLLWVLGLSALLVASLGVSQDEGRWITAVVVAVLVVSMALFASLTVEVATTHVSLAFGPGLIRRRFPLEEIEGARAVTNRWYYGWGIRLTPHGWLYNVSGFDAVELVLKSRRKVRIGTDEPGRLLAAIRRANPSL